MTLGKVADLFVATKTSRLVLVCGLAGGFVARLTIEFLLRRQTSTPAACARLSETSLMCVLPASHRFAVNTVPVLVGNLRKLVAMIDAVDL